MASTDQAKVRVLKQMIRRIRGRTHRSAAVWIAGLALIVGVVGFGWLVNYSINLGRDNHNLIAQGHTARIADQNALQAEIRQLEAENAVFRANAAVLANNNRDLACFTAAFFNTPPGVAPFIDSLRVRYRCDGYDPKKPALNPTAAATYTPPGGLGSGPGPGTPSSSPHPSPTPTRTHPRPHPSPTPTRTHPKPRPTLPITIPSALCELLQLPDLCSGP